MVFVDRAKGLLFAGDNLYDGPIFVQDQWWISINFRGLHRPDGRFRAGIKSDLSQSQRV